MDRFDELKAYLLNSHPQFSDSPMSIETLLDAIIAIYDDYKAYPNSERNPVITRFIQKCKCFRQLVSTILPKMHLSSIQSAH